MNILFRLMNHFTTSALNLMNIRHINIFQIVLCNLCFSPNYYNYKLLLNINMPLFF